MKEKIVLITGAAGDIDRATVMRFVEEDAVVILSDLDARGCECVLAETGV